MNFMKFKLIAKKTWLWAKKFWWVIIIGLGFVIAILAWMLTKNGAYVAGLIDLMEAKRDAHDQEMETLAHIHNTEVADKNLRLEEYIKKRDELEEEFKKRGEVISKEKEADLKRILDESYNDPEKLARELAKAFGLNEHG